ncbi:Uncharacterized protein LW93_310 [Fusarium fujikuroi]|nr:Uncharacterized protein LW93_310 [Fusarium fujikuroi]
MHILGIANGTPGGNSEILLKAALRAATKTYPSITTSWIHVPSLWIPPSSVPLESSLNIPGTPRPVSEIQQGIRDDRKAVLQAIMAADALIFSTPVQCHTPAGGLKALTDMILGPHTDAALAHRVSKAQDSGDKNLANIPFNPQLLKPRVAGFLAVAGSTTPDQITMVLPTLHLLIYSLHAKVVDQEVLLGNIMPGAVVFNNNGKAVERAERLGVNVASQIGKSHDEARYLGPIPPGACPYCHLSKIDLFGREDNKIGCITCGADGYLKMDSDGVVRPHWNSDSDLSCITMAGKQKHVDDLVAWTRKETEAIGSNPEASKRIDELRNIEITAAIPIGGHGNDSLKDRHKL